MATALFFLAAVALLAGMAYHGDSTFSTQSFPAWVKDYTNREHVLPGGVRLLPSAFPRRDQVVVTVGAAGAAIGAESVPVDALSGPIPVGTVLYFGDDKVAVLAAAAAKGAVSLTTEPLPVALVDDDTATYVGVGKIFVPAGTLIGRTYAERAAKTAFGPWEDGDDEVFLVLFDVPDLSLSADADVLRPGTLIAENLLPNWATRPSGEQDAIRATYETTIGQV